MKVTPHVWVTSGVPILSLLPTGMDLKIGKPFSVGLPSSMLLGFVFHDPLPRRSVHRHHVVRKRFLCSPLSAKSSSIFAMYFHVMMCRLPPVDLRVLSTVVFMISFRHGQLRGSPSPDGVVVHPNTALALWDQVHFDQLYDRCFFLYVDGSAHSKGAGWSVILVVTGVDARGHMRSCLLGTLHGKVTCTELDKSWLGAQRGDNIDAEIQAATIAIAWFVANHGSLQDRPVFLCPDLQYSEGLIGGSYSPHQDRQTTTVLANLGYVATCFGLQVLHAKAHSGWEWNELADVVAKYAAHESAAWIPPETLVLQQLILDQEGMCRPEWWPGFFLHL